MAGPSVTDWISALSTAALGILGAFITVWQWRLTKFRPQLRSRIDGQREAIELVIVNKGRAPGIIDQVNVLLPDGRLDTGAAFDGFPEAAFRPLQLPALASMRIIIQSPADRVFDFGVRLLVGIGKARPETLTPLSAPTGTGIYGIKSIIPPGSLT
jgi:hypothetical protein